MAKEKIVEYSLSDRLKFIREQRRLSQKEFANAVGISQSSVAQIENGRKEPSLETLRKIAKCLDIDMATIFASKDVHVFDMPRLRRKYKSVDALTPNLYTALGKVVQFAKDIKFLK
jgi:transcriptional regulator with XRE-family HTH domain